MRYFILVFCVGVLFFGCSSKKAEEVPSIQAFSLDIGSYSMDKGWEVDATVQVKDFLIQQQGDTYKGSFSYTVDIVTPDGKKISKISSGISSKEDKEKPSDAQIDIQFNLDSKFVAGKYTVSVNITDELSKKQTTISKPIQIES
jgi:hypothetical protein